jgi:hypothetical protein
VRSRTARNVSNVYSSIGVTYYLCFFRCSGASRREKNLFSFFLFFKVVRLKKISLPYDEDMRTYTKVLYIRLGPPCTSIVFVVGTKERDVTAI